MLPLWPRCHPSWTHTRWGAEGGGCACGVCVRLVEQLVAGRWWGRFVGPHQVGIPVACGGVGCACACVGEVNYVCGRGQLRVGEVKHTAYDRRRSLGTMQSDAGTERLTGGLCPAFRWRQWRLPPGSQRSPNLSPAQHAHARPVPTRRKRSRHPQHHRLHTSTLISNLACQHPVPLNRPPLRALCSQ